MIGLGTMRTGVAALVGVAMGGVVARGMAFAWVSAGVASPGRADADGEPKARNTAPTRTSIPSGYTNFIKDPKAYLSVHTLFKARLAETKRDSRTWKQGQSRTLRATERPSRMGTITDAKRGSAANASLYARIARVA